MQQRGALQIVALRHCEGEARNNPENI